MHESRDTSLNCVYDHTDHAACHQCRQCHLIEAIKIDFACAPTIQHLFLQSIQLGRPKVLFKKLMVDDLNF